jgi:hypothetical protein
MGNTQEEFKTEENQPTGARPSTQRTEEEMKSGIFGSIASFFLTDSELND